MSNRFKNISDLNKWYYKSLINFKNKGNLLWNNKFDYSRFVYVNNKTKGEIECPIHGSFWQTPNDHIAKHDCRKCSSEKVFNYNIKDIKDRENYLVDLYYINLTNHNEDFNKIGISKEYKKRITNIKTKSKSSVIELVIIPMTLSEAYYVEQKIKHNPKFKYKPLEKFPGYTECLNKYSEKDVIQEISNILINDFGRSDLVGKILDWEYANKKTNN